MNDVQVFDFENNQIRTGAFEGEPWWFAVDVCNALTIANGRDAISKLDDDEKMTVGNPDARPGQGAQEFTLINESGLYTLIMTSRKPEAKRFKKWVTSVVLPAIRKTGTYTHKSASSVDVLRAMVESFAEHEGRISTLEKSIGEIQENGSLLPVPKSAEDEFVTPTQIGKMFNPKFSAQTVNRMLRDQGFQRFVGDEWVATNLGADYSYSRPLELQNGRITYQLYWKRKIKDILTGAHKEVLV